MVAFGQGACFWAKLWSSGKSCCNRTKLVVIGQKWLYLGKSGSIRTKSLYSSKSGCIPVKVVVIGKKMFVF